MTKNSKSKWSWGSSKLAAGLLLSGGMLSVGQGQQLEAALRLNGSRVIEAFEPLRAILQQSSVAIYDGRKSVQYGAVVSPDGYFITKASELDGIKDLSVRIDHKEYTEVKLIAATVDWDLALLKVEAEDLVPVQWAESEPSHGSWVVSNGSTSLSRRRVRVGIISANAREVGSDAPVVLGVSLDTSKEVLSIKGVQEKSGAAEAGLASGDVILTIDGKKVTKMEELKEILSTKQPDDRVIIRVMRGEEEKDFEVVLRAREKIFKEEATRNDQMSGRYSKRRSNFRRILQHDVPLSNRSTGGPLLDLDGKCVGINIARANRAETFAIPAAEAIEVTEELLKQAK